jgi:antitoxin MazE
MHSAVQRVDTKRLRPVNTCDYIVITMKARLVRIGNSRGVRLPKAVIDQIGLDEDIDLRVENDRVIITAARQPRTGWADAARRLANESRGLLDAPSPTRFDEDEWRW